jgi:hypothetical protein
MVSVCGCGAMKAEKISTWIGQGVRGRTDQPGYGHVYDWQLETIDRCDGLSKPVTRTLVNIPVGKRHLIPLERYHLPVICDVKVVKTCFSKGLGSAMRMTFNQRVHVGLLFWWPLLIPDG